jgi:hypothetical protein
VLLWLTLPMLVSPASVAATIRNEDRLHAAWLGEAAAHSIRVRALGWLDRAAYAGDNVAPSAPPRSWSGSASGFRSSLPRRSTGP